MPAFGVRSGRRIALFAAGIACIAGLTPAPAHATEAPGVYDIAVNRTLYPASGSMTVTWRAVVPAGMPLVASNCIVKVGSAVLDTQTCSSGVPFTYNAGLTPGTGAVAATVEVAQFYNDPANPMYAYAVNGSIATTIDRDPPTVQVAFLVKADNSGYAPSPMPPSTSYKAALNVTDNGNPASATNGVIQSTACSVKRLSPAPVVTISSYPCPLGTGGSVSFTSPSASGTYELGVTATDPAGNTGSGTKQFVVDATAPSLTITAGPAEGGPSTSTVVFAWTSDDANASFACAFGKPTSMPAPLPCTSPASASGLADGATRVAITATDPLGNSATVIRDFVVDGTLPVLTAVSPVDGGTVTTVPFAITVNASEPVQNWSCKFDQASWAACGTAGSSHLEQGIAASATANGPHTAMIRGVDAAGNLSAPLTINYTVAATPSAILQSGPADGAVSNSPTWSWTSAIPGSTYECSIVPTGSAPSYGPCTATYAQGGGFQAPALSDGPYTFNVRGTATGYGSAVTTRNFTLDVTPPASPVITGPADGATVTTATAAYSFTGEPGTTYECWFDASAVMPCTSPYLVPLTSQGQHSFGVRAIDVAGNRSSNAGRGLYASIGGTASVSGPPRVGVTVSAVGVWTPGTTVSYQWRRDGAPITGAKGRAYVVTSADLKRRLTVTITGVKPNFSAMGVTSPAVVVGYGYVTSGKARIVAPSLRVGARISATASPWTPGTTVRYQWYLNGVALRGSTSPSITLSRSMVGKRLTVVITGTKSGYYGRRVLATSGYVRW